MPTDTVRIQFKVPRVLSAALRLAARNDRRTQQAFLIILLQECHAIKLCMLKNAKSTAKGVEDTSEEASGDTTEEVLPPLRVPAYTDEERANAAAAWRPGQ